MNTLISTPDHIDAVMTLSATLQLNPESPLAIVADTMAILHDWADKGWLRRLDSAMAAFLRDLDASAAPALLEALDALLGEEALIA